MKKTFRHTPLRGGTFLRAISMLCVLCGFADAVPADKLEMYPEGAVKAAFIHRFAGYVSWPAESLPPDRFTIAVLGANDIADYLHELLGRRTLLQRPVHVRRIADVREARNAQILFVGGAARGDPGRLLQPIAGRSVLVITDRPDGLDAGGIINLLLQDRHVRFEISIAAARSSGLRISSDLLALAVTVRE